MSSQVNFYATPGDIGRLETGLGGLADMLILSTRSPTSSPEVLPSLRERRDGEQLLFYHLVRKDDYGAVATRYVPTQGYWTSDLLRSPLVEFTSCQFDGIILRRGRAYYMAGFFDDAGTWVRKPDPFRRWADSVLKKVRRVCGRRGSDSAI